MAFARASIAALEGVIPEPGFKGAPSKQILDYRTEQLVNPSLTQPPLVVTLELAGVDKIAHYALSALSSSEEDL
jgi:hypothetical protein